jgi:hypothetical protein
MVSRSLTWDSLYADRSRRVRDRRSESRPERRVFFVRILIPTGRHSYAPSESPISFADRRCSISLFAARSDRKGFRPSIGSATQRTRFERALMTSIGPYSQCTTFRRRQMCHPRDPSFPLSFLKTPILMKYGIETPLAVAVKQYEVRNWTTAAPPLSRRTFVSFLPPA